MKCTCPHLEHAPKLVVLTGGPGAGKTAVLELARRHFCKHVAVLPEAASIIYGGGFIRKDTVSAKKAGQRAIFRVQRELERILIEEKQASVILCDRGTIDGFAYWPNSEESFWTENETTRALEMARYAAVIHLRTPAAAQGYNLQNPVRIETADQAAIVDKRIEMAWTGHTNRHFVDSTQEFVSKAAHAIDLIRQEVPDCCKLHSLPDTLVLRR